MRGFTRVSGQVRIFSHQLSSLTLLFGVAQPQPPANKLGDEDASDISENVQRTPGNEFECIRYAVAEAGDIVQEDEPGEALTPFTMVALFGDIPNFDRVAAHSIDEWFAKIVMRQQLAQAEERVRFVAAHLLVEVEGLSRYILVARDGTIDRIELLLAYDTPDHFHALDNG